MKSFEKFNYADIDAFESDVAAMRLSLPVGRELGVLARDIALGRKKAPNRMIIHPMEGCDGEENGAPSDLIYRRYRRFATGGAGLLWVEACAVIREGRANPYQLYINRDNLDAFKRLVDNIRRDAGGAYIVLQLTHSGRYSKPGGGLPAVIAAENEYLDKFLPDARRKITDRELSDLEDRFADAAKLAKEAGFDAVDVKACHRYLNSELLSAHTREGDYGGAFENRTRFLLNAIDKIKAVADIDVTTRLNAFDELPFPYGWGVDREDYRKPDFTEPVRLAKLLAGRGIKFINITGGNPYYNPHVNRPCDAGVYTAPYHPLYNVEKLLNAARVIKENVPEMTVIGTGLSWLREFGANVAAGYIEKGWFDMAGFGRQAFAYPDFANDILLKGGMERRKCCISCTKCSVIMRDGGKAGCVIKDSAVYAPIYKAGREGKPPINSARVGESIDAGRKY